MEDEVGSVVLRDGDVDDMNVAMLLDMQEEALNTDDEDLDPSFDLESRITNDPDH